MPDGIVPAGTRTRMVMGIARKGTTVLALVAHQAHVMVNAPLVTTARVTLFQTSSIALILVMPSQRSISADKVAALGLLRSPVTTPLALMTIMVRPKKYALWDTTAPTVTR